MKAQYSQIGKVINYTNHTKKAIVYNDVVALGAHIGVAAEDIAIGSIGSVQIEGVYLLPAMTTEAVAVGDILYLGSDDKVTKTVGDVVAGWAVAPKDAANDTAMVKINDVVILPTATVAASESK